MNCSGVLAPGHLDGDPMEQLLGPCTEPAILQNAHILLIAWNYLFHNVISIYPDKNKEILELKQLPYRKKPPRSKHAQDSTKTPTLPRT